MTPAAMRATRALQKENGRRLLAKEEFMTQEEIAELIDAESGLPELIKALRGLRHPETGDFFGVWSGSVENIEARFALTKAEAR